MAEQADAPRSDSSTCNSQKIISAVQLKDWVVLVPQQDAKGVENLVQTIRKVSTSFGMNISYPKQIIHLPNFQLQTYIRFLTGLSKEEPNLQMIFVILPNNKLELYAAVKKCLAVDHGIPSQCFLAKNVGSQSLMSIATKVVIQMNAKLGGEPWSVKLPLINTMFIGFGAHKRTNGGIVGAMVATISSKFTKYFCTTSTYNDPGEELSRNIKNDIKKCLVAYQKENQGNLPERIFMYRDAIENENNCQMEVTLIKEELDKMYTLKGLKDPKLTFITVSKRINTRLFERKQTSYDNPPLGTVVDIVVTLPEKFDFYLNSTGARQGTVSPCSYNVILNESGLDLDKIQLMTYKMCQLYCNWSGTIAIPAPCLYAHKLAFLTATAVAYSGPANA